MRKFTITAGWLFRIVYVNWEDSFKPVFFWLLFLRGRDKFSSEEMSFLEGSSRTWDDEQRWPFAARLIPSEWVRSSLNEILSPRITVAFSLSATGYAAHFVIVTRGLFIKNVSADSATWRIHYCFLCVGIKKLSRPLIEFSSYPKCLFVKQLPNWRWLTAISHASPRINFLRQDENIRFVLLTWHGNDIFRSSSNDFVPTSYCLARINEITRRWSIEKKSRRVLLSGVNVKARLYRRWCVEITAKWCKSNFQFQAERNNSGPKGREETNV